MKGFCHKGFEPGSALIEFAVVIPVLLMLILGTLEFGDYFQNQQKLVNITWEIANLSLRNCPMPPPVPSEQDLENCLMGMTADLQSLLTDNFQDFDNLGTLIITPLLSGTPTVYRFKYPASSQQTSRIDFSNIRQDKDVGFTVELFYKRKDASSASINFHVNLPRELYEAAVI